MNVKRVRAVVRKEMREYRRNPFVIGTMAISPLVFVSISIVIILITPASATSAQAKAAVGVVSLVLLMVPVVLPPIVSSYSVVGEREQGTLEPVLAEPLRASEFLVGKAAAAFIPTVGLTYALYLIVAISIRAFAAPVVRNAAFHLPELLAQLLFAPLLALWAIWVGIAFSTRSSDVRVAQQLATLAALPPLAFTTLITFQLITPSVALAVGLALALLVVDTAAARVVSRLFDPERLITGHRNQPAHQTPAGRS